MIDNIKKFQESFPTIESYWRSITLFGRNTAAYKFALAKALLELAPKGKEEITLEELAYYYSKCLCEHLAVSPKQTTNNSSSYIKACMDFNNGEISLEKLIEITEKDGFKYVIDAFHNVNDEKLPIDFYIKDYSKTNDKKLILTDELLELASKKSFEDLTKETESRWQLVESAWELQIARNLLEVEFDRDKNIFFVENQKVRRKNITSSRDALNGYQKGKCFYCFDDISLNPKSNNFCDVDHFFPYALQPAMKNVNLNGVWNLVLACNRCNRGADGKFAKIPRMEYLERLYRRNEFLISSYHPLRETLINQTGATSQKRIEFLKSVDEFAINLLVQRWSTELVGKEIF